jgi:hypothetical protein
MAEAALAYTSFDEMPAEQRYIWKLAARIRMARHYAAEKNVLAWNAVVFPHIFYLPYCMEFHSYLVDIRGLEFTWTFGPRNHAKTAVGDFGISIYQALNEPEIFNHYLFVQGSQDKALALNRMVKNEIESNEVIRAVYGDMMGNRWTDQQFELANHVAFTAVSTGTSVRGLMFDGRRPDYIMPDDLYNEEHINNPEATLKVNEWFWSTLYNARAKTKRWSIHGTGTAINDYDLGAKMEKEGKSKDGNQIVFRRFKAVKNFDTKDVLWPELHGAGGKDPFASVMLDFTRMGTHIAMRELQNEPRDETTAIIKRSWLYKPDGRSWEYDPHELNALLNNPDADVRISSIRIGNDPSIGKKNDSDPTGTALVIETMHKDGSEFWIENIDAERMTLGERKAQLQAWAKDRPEERPVNEVRIEAIGGFDDYATYVITETNLPVHRVEWVPDKITNLENRSHYFENGKVHVSNLIPREKIDKLVQQLTTNYPENDDMRDAVLLTMDLEPASWEKFMR